MRWQLVCAGIAAALASMGPFAASTRAADAGLASPAETRVDVRWPHGSRAYVPRRRTVVVVRPRYRYARAHVIWQVDANSVQPAYILRW
jgi:hypothetical protein